MKCTSVDFTSVDFTSVDFKWEKKHDDFITQKKKEISNKEVPYNKIWRLIAIDFNAVFNENVTIPEIKNRDMQLVNCSAQNKPFTESEKQLILERVRLHEQQKRSISDKKMKHHSFSRVLNKDPKVSSKKRNDIVFVDQTNHFTRSEENNKIKKKLYTYDSSNKKGIKFTDLSKKFLNLQENKSNSNSSEKIVVSDTNFDPNWLEVEQVASSNKNTKSDPTITFQDDLLFNSELSFELNNDDFQIFLNNIDNENPTYIEGDKNLSKQDLSMSELGNSTTPLDEGDQFFESLLNDN